MREDGLLNQALPYYLIPLDERKTACGSAFTIKGCPSVDFDENKEMEERAKMLDDIHPGSFVVWDTTGDTTCAHYGGMMAKASKLSVGGKMILPPHDKEFFTHSGKQYFT